MNLDDAAGWARSHKAAAIGAGAAALLALLWLHHRAKANSNTAGVTGATVNGAGDYLVPFNNSDPAGYTGNQAYPVTGSTTPTGSTPPPTGATPGTGTATPAALDAHQLHLLHEQRMRGVRTPRLPVKPTPAALDAHQLHLLHLQQVKSPATKLDAHQLHLLHLQHAGIATPPPSATRTPTGAHSGQTATPGGATSTGAPRPIVTPRPRRTVRRIPLAPGTPAPPYGVMGPARPIITPPIVRPLGPAPTYL